MIDIKVPYTTRPMMQRRSGPAFRVPASVNYIEAKAAELVAWSDQITAQINDDHTGNLVQQAALHCGKPATASIQQLAMHFQEDIAIMHCGRLQAVCFCFPSGWIPAQRLGATLAEIHQPVADGADLVRMSARLTDIMADVTLGGFQRQVWTVTANSELSNLPGRSAVPEPRSLAELYLRWETQTTEPLGDGQTSLFFVDVNVVPLQSVWAELGQRICQSVNSMSESVLAYKNLTQIKTLLNGGIT